MSSKPSLIWSSGYAEYTQFMNEKYQSNHMSIKMSVHISLHRNLIWSSYSPFFRMCQLKTISSIRKLYSFVPAYMLIVYLCVYLLISYIYLYFVMLFSICKQLFVIGRKTCYCLCPIKNLNLNLIS